MKTKSCITSVFFMAIILLISGSQKSFSAVLLDRVIATVNDEVVTWSELMSMMTLEMNKEKKQDVEKIFLNKLVEMKLQLQEARNMGLDVNDAEIDAAINDIKNKFNMTDESLKSSLIAENMTFEDYRKKLGEQILLQKVVNFAVKSSIVITDKEIEEYYEANRDKYDEKEKLKIRQIFLALPEDDMQKKDIENKAQEIINKINEGEDFAKLAMEYSDGPAKDFGGDLGYVTKGSALKEIEDVAFALKIGDVSKPFWSPAGLHIIKLEERKQGGGIEKAKDRIKEALFQQKMKVKYHEWLTGLKEKAYVEIKL